MISIEVIQGPDKGRLFHIDDGEVLIGRQSSTVPLSDGTVSRQHARMVKRGEMWIIEDAGSANGTFVNGFRTAKPTRLHLGDQIRVGTTLMVFGSSAGQLASSLRLDDNGRDLDAAIMATVPASEDSVIIPTPEAGAEAIGNLRILYNLATEVSSVFNLDTLLSRTLDVIFDVIRADRAYILLVGEDGQLIPTASRDRGENSANEVPVSRTIINEVVAKQIGVLSSNAMRDKRFSAGQSVHAFGIRSAICAPIKGREKVLGVIHIDSSVADHTYSTEQLRLLTAIGYQTGLAVENVRLYESAVKTERLTAVGETVAVLSHHIKNILQALGAGTELVGKALEQGNAAKAQQAWPIVRRSLDRINAVILNMLAFSKQRQPLLETVNVNHVLQECIDLMSPHADERSVALLADLTEVPPVAADAAGLHQAFLNLIANALDAVSPSTGVITTASSFDPLRQEVIVNITDNGVGIPAGELDRIFEAFHSSKGQKGTGLGLAVTRKIVQEHHGRLNVRSAPGKGTTFTIHLSAQRGGIAASGETLVPGRNTR